jgi:hypothetical protein
VRPITERLLAAPAASAPPVRLPSLHLDLVGPFWATIADSDMTFPFFCYSRAIQPTRFRHTDVTVQHVFGKSRPVAPARGSIPA